MGGDQKPKFVPARDITIRAKDGTPPTWALATVVGSIGFVLVVVALIRWGVIPAMESTWFYVGLIALPMVTLIAVAVISKSIEFKSAQAWISAPGTIVRSELIAKHHQFAGSPETVDNVPTVEYEFTVRGQKYRGNRIGIGDDTGGAHAGATLARYPLGANVTVFYDANDPTKCVLERGGPFAHDSEPADTIAAPAAQSKGWPTSIAVFVLVLTIVGLISNGTAYFAQHFPKGEPEISVFVLCFGLAILIFFLVAHRRSKQAQRWPSVRGKVIKSEVEEFRERTDGHTSTAFRPVVEYAYRVRGLDYRSNQIKLGVTTSGTRSYAESVTSKYRAGDELDVHYDPADPTTAALENPTGATWILAALAAGFFALAAYTLGVFK